MSGLRSWRCRRRCWSRHYAENLPNHRLHLAVFEVIERRRPDTALSSTLASPLTSVCDAENGFHAKSHALGKSQGFFPLANRDVR